MVPGLGKSKKLLGNFSPKNRKNDSKCSYQTLNSKVFLVKKSLFTENNRPKRIYGIYCKDRKAYYRLRDVLSIQGLKNQGQGAFLYGFKYILEIIRRLRLRLHGAGRIFGRTKNLACF